MNKKLEIRYANTGLDTPDQLLYGNKLVSIQCRVSSVDHIWEHLISDYTAMQSKLETLRSKGKAFDWIEKNSDRACWDHAVTTGEHTVWIRGAGDDIGRGDSVRLAIEDFIAKHEVEKPNKGDTMKADSKMELKIVNIVSSDFSPVYTLYLNDIPMSVELSEAKHRDWQTFISYFAFLESRLAELEKLAEAVEFANGEQITISNDPKSGWTAWYWDDDDAKPAPQFPHKGNTFVSAVAGSREKHPEPEEDTSVIMAKYIIEMYDNEESLSHYWHARLVKMAHKILARERGE